MQKARISLDEESIASAQAIFDLQKQVSQSLSRIRDEAEDANFANANLQGGVTSAQANPISASGPAQTLDINAQTQRKLGAQEISQSIELRTRDSEFRIDEPQLSGQARPDAVMEIGAKSVSEQIAASPRVNTNEPVASQMIAGQTIERARVLINQSEQEQKEAENQEIKISELADSGANISGTQEPFDALTNLV